MGREVSAPDEPLPVGKWHKNAALFLATTASVFFVGTFHAGDLAHSWQFAIPLLAILLFHEFGHWFAARIHRVRASLPYFIPFPIGLLGTLGAVINMPERIRSRNALLDIGAAGPLAGMVVALPTMFVGIALSPVERLPETGYILEGQSLLYGVVKWLVHGHIPEGHDVILHPAAFAAWAGFLITSINLLPWGQLDGGHIAYALFGERQDDYGRWVRRALLVLFAGNAIYFLGRHLAYARGTLGDAMSNSAFWLVWYGLTALLGRISGHDHPPCEPGDLGPKRRVVAWACLVLFFALLMPTPWATY